MEQVQFENIIASANATLDDSVLLQKHHCFFFISVMTYYFSEMHSVIHSLFREQYQLNKFHTLLLHSHEIILFAKTRVDHGDKSDPEILHKATQNLHRTL